jgi:DNA-binding NarL/FixJ family response regulator
MEEKLLRILIVDDHEVVRLGIKSLLKRHAQFQVVAEAGNAQDALQQALQHKPDVVIMDIRLPGKNGIGATRDIIEKLPETKVIMLTSYAEDNLLFDAILAGGSPAGRAPRRSSDASARRAARRRGTGA